MTISKCLMATLFSMLMVGTGMSQPEYEGKKVDPAIVADPLISAAARQGLSLWAVQQTTDESDLLLNNRAVVNNLAVPLLWMNRQNNLAAKDGNYLAQSKAELQTYYDLGMTYQYIESPLMRQQLELADEQGIMILTTDPEAEGAKSGFVAGDLVLMVQGEPVDTQYDLVQALTECRGKNGSVRLRRRGEAVSLSIALSEVQIPDDEKKWIIGVSIDPASETIQSHLQTNGVIVNSVTAESPAEKMGLKEHDLIEKIDDVQIQSLRDLRKIVRKSNGKLIKLDLIRAGNRMTISLKPMEDVDAANPNERMALDMTYMVTPRLEQFRSRPVQLDLSKDVTRALSRAWLAPSKTSVTTSVTNEESKLDRLSRQIEELKKQIDTLQKMIEK